MSRHIIYMESSGKACYIRHMKKDWWNTYGRKGRITTRWKIQSEI